MLSLATRLTDLQVLFPSYTCHASPLQAHLDLISFRHTTHAYPPTSSNTLSSLLRWLLSALPRRHRHFLKPPSALEFLRDTVLFISSRNEPQASLLHLPTPPRGQTSTSQPPPRRQTSTPQPSSRRLTGASQQVRILALINCICANTRRSGFTGQHSISG